MAKTKLFNFKGIILLFLCIAFVHTHGGYHSQSVPLPSTMQEKITNLHFFMHDIVGGQNPSSVRVAKAKGSSEQLGEFGNLMAINDPLTVGPELSSGVIGNAQGLYVFSDRSESSLVAYFDFGFTAGEFNGSSISMMSRNVVLNAEREMAVVGGRGKFRMARGFAELKTCSMNSTEAIVEYNVMVFHY
ncbi:dirigent protein 4-like [Carica papaya]|uniref:dirigent protein 4-like n=1 Tax=Carica papaya TaxID=3649 RepID=UPI000B8CA8B5|nr:dirigent protein 4-like [Carica papaya]